MNLGLRLEVISRSCCHTLVISDDIFMVMVTSHKIHREGYRRFWKDDIITTYLMHVGLEPNIWSLG